jgi:hypothetical protein
MKEKQTECSIPPELDPLDREIEYFEKALERLQKGRGRKCGCVAKTSE